MNKVILSGRITNDLEIKMTKETEILTFGIAVQRDKDKADFINVTAFNKTAEMLKNYCGKGDKILVEGALHQSNFTDKDGKNRVTYSVYADRVEFMEKKKQEPNQIGSPKNIQYTEEELPFYEKAY